MKQTETKSFILYHDVAEPLMMLSVRERGELMTAIFAYETGIPERVPRLSPKAELLFSIIMKALDRNREAYAEKCARRAEIGRIGGRSRRKNVGEVTAKSVCFQNEAKEADNENDNKNKNDNDHKNKNDNVNQNDSGSKNKNENGNEAHAPSGAGEFSTSPEHADAVPPTDRPTLSREERARIFREEIPRSYIRSRLDRAEVYAEEHDMSIGDVIVYWWLYDRAET